MPGISSEKIVELTNNILAQAKYYLKDADEFYPFGTVIDKDQNLKPVSFYSGEEFPDSIELLKSLEEAIKKGITQNDYLSAAIGIDVYLKIDNEKKTALEIRIYSSNSVTKIYFIYCKKNSEYIFEPYTEKKSE